MTIDDIKEMLKKSKYARNTLIVKKKYYDEHKKEIDNLLKEDPTTSISITNMIENKTDVRIVDTRKLYGGKQN